MATNTTNYNLVKPAYADTADIADINGNMDVIDGQMKTNANGVSSNATAINNVQDGLAIVATGNTHAAIPAGRFVYIKNHGSLADGLYKNTSGSTIAANATLSSSNVTADSTGGLNDLASDIATINSNTLKKTSPKILSGDLDDYYGDDKTGLYYVGSGVTNSELDYSGLIVIAQGTYGAQIQFDYRSVVVRTRTGNPATWGNWTYLTQSLANGYVGASQTKTYALTARITYILTISNIASNDVQNVYTAMVVAPPSSSNAGKIVWLTSAPPNSVTVSLSGFTLTVASSSNIWINVALTRM